VYFARVERITTANEAIDKLGGTGAVAAMVGISAQAVSNWRAKGNIPPEYYLLLSAALVATGASVDPQVFGLRQGASDIRAASTETLQAAAPPVDMGDEAA
jgi:hypothetical protein